MSIIILSLSFSLLTLSLPSFASNQETPITVHYSERSPYSTTTAEGKAVGLIIEPVEKALRKAKIPFIWVSTPINRQFMILKENLKATDQKHCAVGGLKTAEREDYAKFTVPFYKTKGLVVVTSLNLDKTKYSTFESVMKKFTILVKENYSYGKIVDELMVKLSPSKVIVSGESEQMLEMVSNGHGDYMVISLEVIEDYFKREPKRKKKLQIMRYKEIAETLDRYMMCSKSVSDKIMIKINKALAR